MDKDSKAYKCKEYEELFAAADSSQMACEDVAVYERDLRKLEEMNAGALYAAEVAREEGLAQGREEGRAEIIRQMHAGGFSCEKIADTLSMPIAEIRKALRLD